MIKELLVEPEGFPVERVYSHMACPKGLTFVLLEDSLRCFCDVERVFQGDGFSDPFGPLLIF